MGKLVLGIRVPDLNGQRISFARASGRYFAEILSAATLYIGFLMVAFNPRKRALHDFLAGTVVYKRWAAELAASGQAGAPPPTT